MVLKTVITGNPHFCQASQSGLKSFLFGSAAFLQKEDFVLILFWSLFSLSLFFLFRRAFCLYCFDPEYGEFLGGGGEEMHILLRFLLIPLLALGIKMLGVLLMASFLVLPMLFCQRAVRKAKRHFPAGGAAIPFLFPIGNRPKPKPKRLFHRSRHHRTDGRKPYATAFPERVPCRHPKLRSQNIVLKPLKCFFLKPLKSFFLKPLKSFFLKPLKSFFP